jgi:hypothetical protein
MYFYGGSAPPFLCAIAGSCIIYMRFYSVSYMHFYTVTLIVQRLCAVTLQRQQYRLG